MADLDNSPPVFDPAEWDAFCDGLKKTGQQIMAHTPDNGLDQTEGFRYLARLTQHALGRFVERGNPLAPQFDYNAPRIGGDNPDFVYASASIRGGHRYCIRGRREQAFNIGFGSYYGGLGSGQGLQCSGYVFLNDLQVEDDGSFEIVVSEQEQPGNWLPVTAQSNAILIRQTVLDRRHDNPADLSIELLESDVTIEPLPPLTVEAFSQSLQLAGLFVGGVVGQFLGWSNDFKQRPNQLQPINPELLKFAQGDPSTRYHNGYFELADDEALVIELDPPACEYWNLQLANHWLESLDFLEYNTHINQFSAVLSDDGKVRAVVAKHDPGVANWLNTAGHQRGCLSMRWVKAEQQSIARTQVVPLSEVPRIIAEQCSL